MRRTVFMVAAAGSMLTLLALPASAEPRTQGGCQAFGRQVALLGQTLGRDFGATASGVASSGPQALPTAVVFPEQAALCP
jgi:hypothetical protein